jgi:hypothetical protein
MIILFIFSAPTYSTSVRINGEDSQQFLAGFAENIGLEYVRAATIVSAAVAARTRSCLLQAWVIFFFYKIYIIVTTSIIKAVIFSV